MSCNFHKMIYKCHICENEVEILVFKVENQRDFVCDACEFKKIELQCLDCQRTIKRTRNNSIKVCFECLKKRLIKG